MGSICYSSAKYQTSAADVAGLPEDAGAEVAFIGRSNSGKSSALNTITGIKSLARTSSTPGRTQMINFFDLGDDHRLVDLPGYGYAKVPKPMKEKWLQTTNEYLQIRQCLRGLVLVMDVRHPLKELDWQLVRWTDKFDLHCHVLLTKADKLKPNKARQMLKEVQRQLLDFQAVTVGLFSSQNRVGLDEARSVVDHWLQ